MRILVVEDEMLVALMLEDILDSLGHQVVGPAMRLPQALELAATCEVDLAILDINLDGSKSFPVADVLSKRGVPFLFATGYGVAGLEAPYKDRFVLSKPFAPHTLQAALIQAA